MVFSWICFAAPVLVLVVVVIVVVFTIMYRRRAKKPYDNQFGIVLRNIGRPVAPAVFRHTRSLRPPNVCVYVEKSTCINILLDHVCKYDFVLAQGCARKSSYLRIHV